MAASAWSTSRKICGPGGWHGESARRFRARAAGEHVALHAEPQSGTKSILPGPGRPRVNDAPNFWSNGRRHGRSSSPPSGPPWASLPSAWRAKPGRTVSLSGNAALVGVRDLLLVAVIVLPANLASLRPYEPPPMPKYDIIYFPAMNCRKPKTSAAPTPAVPGGPADTRRITPPRPSGWPVAACCAKKWWTPPS